MKRNLLKLSALVLIILCVAALGILSMNKVEAEDNVIYIADVAKGTGDGSSAANAMGNSDAYNTTINGSSVPASNSEYYGSAFYKAASQLSATGGTIVVCDELTVKYGDQVSAFGGTANFYMPATSGTLTITSVYGGTDYRTTAGAAFNLSTEFYNMRIHLTGKTVWENLDIVRSYVGTRGTMFIACRAHETVFGDGLSTTQLKTDDTPATVTDTAAYYPSICGGAMWGATNADVNVTINSGTWYKLQSANNFPNSASGNVNGDVAVTINGGTFRGDVMATTDSTGTPSEYANSARITGDFTLNITGGTFVNIYCTTALNLANTTRTVANSAGFGNVEGNVTLNISGGTMGVIYITGQGRVNSSGAVVNHGQVGGSATVTISGNPTFNRINLGGQGFKTASGKFTLKMVGDQWNATSNTLDTFAFVGAGSEFVASGGYRYAIMDLSGMTYAQYWNKAMNNTNQNLINHAYFKFTGVAGTPTFAPETITSYGSRGNSAYGFNEIIEPYNALESIAITTPPTTVAYNSGSLFDPAGMVVTATYASAHTLPVTEYTWSPAGAFASTDTEVIISYTESEVTKTASQPVTITSVALTGISVTTQPDKTAYYYGDTFDSTGLVIEATFEGGSTSNVAIGDLVIPSAPFTTLGAANVTVSYTLDGVTKSVDVPVTVNDYIVSLTAVSGTYATSIKIGETYDYTGIEITRVMAAGASASDTFGPDYTPIGDNSPYSYASVELYDGVATLKLFYDDLDVNPDSVYAEIIVNILSEIEVENGIIYVSDTGTGDGKTAANPLGPAANYPTSVSIVSSKLVDQNGVDLTGTSYQGGAMFRAMYALKDTGGTIVIVGNTSFAYAGNNIGDATIAGNATANYRTPVYGNNKITITDTDGTATYSARLIYSAIFTNPRIHFRGMTDIICDTLTVHRYNGVNATPYLAFNGYKSNVTVENVTQELYTVTGGVITAGPTASTNGPTYPMLIGGEIWGGGITGGTDLTVNGGTWYTIYGASQFGGMSILSLVTGDVLLTLNDVTAKGTVYGTSTSINSGGEAVVNTCRVDGDITVTINGGTFTSFLMFGKNGFATTGKTYTLKINDYDNITINNSLAFWANGGSAWLAGSIKGTRVLDFSGMSYADYWAKTTTLTISSVPTVTPLNESYRMSSTAARQNGTYGSATINADAGFDQVIGPTCMPTAIEITALPDKTVYYVGEEIDFTGLEFSTTYENNEGNQTGLTTGFTYEDGVKAELASLLNAGAVQEVTISYTDKGKTVSTTFDIKVVASDYVGSSIRLSGNEGLRFKVKLSNALRNADIAVDGIAVKEFGILVARSTNFLNSGTTTLTLDDVRDAANPTGMAIKAVCLSRDFEADVSTWKDNHYDSNAVANDSSTAMVNYTAVVIDSASGQADVFKATSFTFRDYMIVTDGTVDYVIYGDYSSYTDASGAAIDAGNGIARNIEYIANQISQAEFDAMLAPYNTAANQARINSFRTDAPLTVTIS